MQRMSITLDSRRYVIRPLSGPYAGQVVATAEQLRIKQAAVKGLQVSGIIDASWGVDLLVDSLPEITRSLGIGRSFGPMGRMTTFKPGLKEYESRILRLPERVLEMVHLDDFGLHIPIRVLR